MDDSLIITLPFSFDLCTPARGMRKYDFTAITKEQQIWLDEMKMDVRRDTEKYLSTHDEVEYVVKMFLRAVMIEKPRDVPKYACQFFSQPYYFLRQQMRTMMKEHACETQGIPFEQYFSFDSYMH